MTEKENKQQKAIEGWFCTSTYADVDMPKLTFQNRYRPQLSFQTINQIQLFFLRHYLTQNQQNLQKFEYQQQKVMRYYKRCKLFRIKDFFFD